MSIVKILDGKEYVIQAENSDVKLHVPKGVKGLLLGNIHTDISRFSHLIPRNDCLIGPICEFSLHPVKDHPVMNPKGEKFCLQIPHIVKQLDRVRDRIKVRCWKNGDYFAFCFFIYDV